jgi:hypothetical protein
LVTDRTPEILNQPFSEKDARDLARRGGKLLPIAEAGFDGQQCYVLVYHFERRVGGETVQLSSSPYATKTHLIRAGLSRFVE